MLNKILRPNSATRQRLRLASGRFNFAVNSHLRTRFSVASGGQLQPYLRDVYLPSWYGVADLEQFHASAEGKHALHNHLERRLQLDRYQFVPWINSVLHLAANPRILEIGCGTGSATVSLAEQGAIMTALDLHAEALRATEIRCREHRVNVTCVNGNAQDLRSLFKPGEFSLIIFFAVLEHMTLEERRASLEAAWAMLKPGQYLCITDTPNRLWPYDSHTSQLPFFHWLPDELAIEYAAHSPRYPFNQRYRDKPDRLGFIREGRGVSYHEIEIALGSLPEVVSDQTAFTVRHNPAKALKRVLARDGARERLLNSYAPNVPRAWFRQNLNIIARKG